MKFLQFSTYPDFEARASLSLKPLDVSAEINLMPLICIGEGAQCGAIETHRPTKPATLQQALVSMELDQCLSSMMCPCKGQHAKV